jgi:DNA polymerase-3 subunit alpha
MLTQVREMNTKRARNGNSRYIRCKVEDFTWAVEAVMWPDDYARYKETIVEDRPLIVKGVVERNREEPGLVLTRILTMEQATQELAKGLYLLVQPGRHKPSHIDALAEVLRKAPGTCPVYLTVRDTCGKDAVLKLDREFSVNPATYPHDDLETLLGTGCVRLR